MWRQFVFIWFPSFWFGITVAILAQTSPTDIELEIGLIQRFGNEEQKEISIASTEGDTLTLKFMGGDGKPKTLTTPQVKLEITQQNLPTPRLQEWVILSDNATFETAEHKAKEWQAKGIPVEITQPRRWQVWAKRSVYQTPSIRRLLVENLTKAGAKDVYLETRVLQSAPVVSFVVAGFRYNRAELAITTNKRRVRITTGKEKPETRLYGGDLQVQPNSYGDFTVVNKVPLELYLRGVVPHEIGPTAPYPSVEAQAVIARTYVLRNLRRFRADNYQLCATVHCQVYKGLTGTVENADRAIETTKGLVLTYKKELVDALYSASSGGVIGPFEDTWEGETRLYLQPKIDSAKPVWDLVKAPLTNEENFRRFIALKEGFNGASSPVFRWQKIGKIEDLTADLALYLERTKHPLAGIKQIKGMEVTERSRSGRILTLKVETDKGVVELYKNESRSAFGPPRSTLFYVEPVFDQRRVLTGYNFIGGGFGHGVGLSQYSSYTLAQLGWRSPSILAFYYPGTKLEPLNNSIVFYPEEEEIK